MTTQRDLTRLAGGLANVLSKRQRRIVFAESCTGGLISNALTRVAGISEWHCGSAVVYRIETKAEWLGVDREILIKPGPVSKVVAAAMSEGVLSNTPEADIAASITGHLGPNAPAKQDGLIYVGISQRDEKNNNAMNTKVKRHVLESAKDGQSGLQLRNQRQRSAAAFVLTALTDFLSK